MNDMIAAVRGYLTLMREPPAEENDRIRALARVLDTLSFTFHVLPIPAKFQYDGKDASYDAKRQLAASVFPSFGFYAVVLPTQSSEQQFGMGDAIDDLADIADEMESIEFVLEEYGAQAAAEQFYWGFRVHWGRHLLDLRSYIHHKYYEEVFDWR